MKSFTLSTWHKWLIDFGDFVWEYLVKSALFRVPLGNS